VALIQLRISPLPTKYALSMSPMLATAAAIAPPPPPRSGEERRGERARVGGEAATEQLFEIASTRNGERAKRNGTRTHTARPRRSCLSGL
jgi:hypothetical protein